MNGSMRIVAVGLSLAATTPALLAQPADAKRLHDVLTGNAKGRAADNPQCKLFKPDEIARYVGAPVDAGQNAGMGTGCQWAVRSGDGDAMVVVVPARYHEVYKSAKGYRALPDIGKQGFVSTYLDGWIAGAIIGDDAVRVTLAGPKANDANTVALLNEAIARRKR